MAKDPTGSPLHAPKSLGRLRDAVTEPLFMSQSLNRIKLGGLVRRIKAKEDAHECGRSER